MKLPNNYGSIQKLSGNRRKPYRVVKTIGWDKEGKQIRKTIGYYESRTIALQELALYNENPYDIDTRNITLEALYDKWYNEKLPKVSNRTKNCYKMVWKYCDEIRNMIFVDIRLNHLQHIVDCLGDKWSAKREFKIVFNQLYDYAIKNNINVKKYSEYIEIGKNKPKLERKPFEQWEIDKMWKNIDRMDYIDTILILIYTGLRIGELFEIEIKNVHVDEKYMRGGFKTEAGTNRVVPIHDRILPLVKKYYDHSVKVGCKYLITNSLDNQMKYSNYKREKWFPMMEQLGLSSEHRPHDTRHTFATMMDRTPANKLSIKRIMGHSSQDITDKVYTHKDIEDLIEAVNYLD